MNAKFVLSGSIAYLAQAAAVLAADTSLKAFPEHNNSDIVPIAVDVVAVDASKIASATIQNTPVADDETTDIDADAGTLDKDGIPWDDRIHSTPAKLKNDNTWRRKRGVTNEMVAGVEAELRAKLSSGNQVAGAGIPAPANPVNTLPAQPWTVPPTQPATTAAPVQTMQPAAPVQTMQPVQPVATAPVQTMQPMQSMQPAAAAPVQTMQSAAPVQSVSVTFTDLMGSIQRGTQSGIITTDILNNMNAAFGINAITDVMADANAINNVAAWLQQNNLWS